MRLFSCSTHNPCPADRLGQPGTEQGVAILRAIALHRIEQIPGHHTHSKQHPSQQISQHMPILLTADLRQMIVEQRRKGLNEQIPHPILCQVCIGGG